MRIILASASPRRAELMQHITEDFEIIPSQEEEVVDEVLDHHELVMELARIKAVSVLNKHPEALVIGCDTIVAVDNLVLGKPKDKEDAFNMLSLLAGRSHEVYTGVCLAKKGKLEQFYSRTEVFFAPLTDEEIYRYIATGEPYDKAGAYGIQGRASTFCERIEGDYFTVMGLPVAMLYKKLESF
ncbi:Maf family protein [Acetanaerobacterium elongatum]|uniref:dTTP/UTP pyrophosphatase n=1 Tax=Acetanaerobacterium elongatum TaxID=258515 RepID=A0A1H0CI74_9FIRM|nr:Maf family protein [Acetanaerobacterium elongatum]SDN57618.1 septum formation protein [Acetanaerobacterium elongatum]